MVMKFFLKILIFLWLIPASTKAQIDSMARNTRITNSFKAIYDTLYPDLKYSYIDSLQIHNYSGNWDLDRDGTPDSLLFVGEGGAHLYYYLRIILSSDKKVRNFPFVRIDYPYLGKISDLKRSNFYPPPLLPQFVIYNFDEDLNLNDEIYIHLDSETFYFVPDKLKRQGLTSSYILLKYERGNFIIRNFIR